MFFISMLTAVMKQNGSSHMMVHCLARAFGEGVWGTDRPPEKNWKMPLLLNREASFN